MKLRYLFIALASSLVLFAGCEKEDPTSLESIQLDKTYLSIPAAGGTVTLNIKAKEAWSLAKDIQVGTEKDADGKNVPVYDQLPAWLTASTLSGSGDGSITFTAPAIDGGREQEFHILCGDLTQFFIIRQGSLEAVKATCAEVLAGADGKTFTTSGICTSIANTNYGNWYLNDGTGEVYIYGTVDATGSYNWSSFGIEVGDEVTVTGPKTTYNGTVELVDVSVVKVVKALLKIDGEAFEFPKEGGEFSVKAAYKGNGVFVNPAQDWVVLSGMDYIKGVASKIEPNPADTAVVKFKVLPNTDDARSCEVEFISSKGDQSSTQTVKVSQGSGLAAYKLPYEESFLGSKGAWETADIVPVDGVASIWYNDASYGMVAKATKAIDGQAELVGPNIDLTAVSSAVLSFEHVQRFAGNVNEELKLFASTDNGTSWTELLIPNYSDGKSWTYVPSGEISLKRFVGNLVKIKFVYTSNPLHYATWEIKNLSVKEGEAAITNIAGLNNSATTAEAAWTGTFTDAVVTYVNGNNAFIQDASAGIQLYLKDHGLSAGMKINGTVSGKIKLYNGYAELTAVDGSKASVTTGAVPEPTVMTLHDLLASYLRWQNCQVKLEGVTFTTALTASNRQGKITQGGDEIAAYSQVNGKVIMDGTGDLVCWPVRYNATLQVGCWDSTHFTKK